MGYYYDGVIVTCSEKAAKEVANLLDLEYENGGGVFCISYKDRKISRFYNDEKYVDILNKYGPWIWTTVSHEYPEGDPQERYGGGWDKYAEYASVFDIVVTRSVTIEAFS